MCDHSADSQEAGGEKRVVFRVCFRVEVPRSALISGVTCDGVGVMCGCVWVCPGCQLNDNAGIQRVGTQVVMDSLRWAVTSGFWRRRFLPVARGLLIKDSLYE